VPFLTDPFPKTSSDSGCARVGRVVIGRDAVLSWQARLERTPLTSCRRGKETVTDGAIADRMLGALQARPVQAWRAPHATKDGYCASGRRVAIVAIPMSAELERENPTSFAA
jgi:hypothetical protein